MEGNNNDQSRICEVKSRKIEKIKERKKLAF
jgi:hypothetical protein